MRRRHFLQAVSATLLAPRALRALPLGSTTRKLKRVGIQLYTLRDAAKQSLAETLAAIAAAGYTDVEMLGGMANFGASPAQVKALLDKNRLRAPSTHVGTNVLDQLDRALDEAHVIGHEYIVVASLPEDQAKTLDDYRRWADKFNEAGAKTRKSGIWLGFHDEAWDFKQVDGKVLYDELATRIDPKVVRLQLDTGNLGVAGGDPIEYMQRYRDKYWQFHIKDVPRLGAPNDCELGKGVIDFRKLLGMIDHIEEKHLYVEQESYPGAPIDSARRNYQYISALEF
jgi:sugar phosphate isomerase/epimerase